MVVPAIVLEGLCYFGLRFSAVVMPVLGQFLSAGLSVYEIRDDLGARKSRDVLDHNVQPHVHQPEVLLYLEYRPGGLFEDALAVPGIGPDDVGRAVGQETAGEQAQGME